MGLPRDIADVIVIATATPVDVLITIFGAAHNSESGFPSTAAVLSTTLSAAVVIGWILATRLL